MAGGHLVTVATAAVKLSKVGNGEVVDDNGATAIVLDNLVLCASGTTAVDGGGLAIVLQLDGESILADGIPPDIGDGAAAVAVNALDLVGA